MHIDVTASGIACDVYRSLDALKPSSIPHKSQMYMLGISRGDINAISGETARRLGRLWESPIKLLSLRQATK